MGSVQTMSFPVRFPPADPCRGILTDCGRIMTVGLLILASCGPEEKVAMNSLTGLPLLVSSWENGHLHGEYKRYYEDGPLWQTGAWEDGLRHGTWTTFAEDGKPLVVEEWERGRRVGTWRSYHPGGVLESEGSHEEGVKHGPWNYFHADGSPRATEIWEYGTRQR